MRHFSASPIEMFANLWRHRDLIKASAKREVLGRYRGSFLGVLWSFFNPLFMLAVYTFVFSVVFQARWGGGSGSKTEFALVLFAGLLVFNLFAECINRAPGLILSNTNYVKKVVFPLEILPFVALLSALFHTLISLGVWLIAYTLFFGIPHLTVFYLPLVLLPFCLFLMGLSWALASLGVFLRDVSQFIGLLTTSAPFFTPLPRCLRTTAAFSTSTR
jgi:lipopolysaccharide transport system permease protein